MLSGLEIRDWLLRLNGKEISNLDAISLLNCPKLSDNPRIKTVEYTVKRKFGMYFDTGHSEKNPHRNVGFGKIPEKLAFSVFYFLFTLRWGWDAN